MSKEQPAYSPLYIKAWTLFTVVLGVILFGMFVLGDHLLNAAHGFWDLIRWLASPII